MIILSLYKKWSPTNKIFFWLTAIGLISGLIFGILSISDKGTNTIEKYIEKVPVTIQDSQCKNDPWVVPTLNTGKAVYISDCDYACRKMNNPENMKNLTLLFSLSPLWKKASSTKFQIISLPDVVSVFIENNKLNLEVTERNGKIQIFQNDAPNTWYLNGWYDIAIGINNKRNVRIYVNQDLITQKDIPNLDVDFNNLILCLGDKNNKGNPFLIDNLLVSPEPVEDSLQYFKKEDFQQIKVWPILDKIKSFFGI